MPETISAPWSLGVAYFSPHPEHRFLFEILDHAGIAYCLTEDPESPEAIAACDVWLVASHLRDGLPRAWREAVPRHVQAGKGLVVLGNPLGVESVFGVEPVSGANAQFGAWLGSVQSMGEGWFQPETGGRADGRPLHFFGGYAFREAKPGVALGSVVDRHGQRSEMVAAVRAGDRAAGLFVDIAATVRHISHGIPVAVDGVPAPDGSAPLNDNILKAEDGLVLDWTMDRDDPCGAGFGFFSEPVADCWREFLLESIFRVAQAAGAPLRVVWYYPECMQALGHISFDTDGSDPDLATELIDVLGGIGIRSTWFVIPPGYTPESGIIAAASADGHDIGFHFDAGIRPESRGAEWSRENFLKQFHEVARACGVEGFRSNKNHYTRWQNAADIIEWCAASGITADESKLPSKPGTLGFFSGSSHPWFHHTPLGEPIGCLEIASLSQDPIVTVPPCAHSALLKAAVSHNGIASFTFHPAHIAKPGVADALRALVAQGRELGLEFWTAAEIADWELIRRGAKLDAGGRLTGKASEAKRPPVVLTLEGGGSFSYLGCPFSLTGKAG